MTTPRKLLLLPGDGIGPEVMREARRIIDWLERKRGLAFEVEEDLVGGASIDTRGTPLADSTLALAKQADAVLFAPSAALPGTNSDSISVRKSPFSACAAS
jgi:3-isopropylmalate dehydrogenase